MVSFAIGVLVGAVAVIAAIYFWPETKEKIEDEWKDLVD